MQQFEVDKLESQLEIALANVLEGRIQVLPNNEQVVSMMAKAAVAVLEAAVAVAEE